MIVLDCNKPTYIDVDDTLISWSPTETELFNHGKVYISPDGLETILVPNAKQIEQLKKHKIRGHTIIVWSAGGSKWAAEAVKFLELEQYVDLVVEKPTWIYDDKQAEEFMPRAQYFKVTP